MPPIFQTIQPITSLDGFWFLRRVTRDVSVNFVHVLVLVFGEVVFVGALDVDNPLT